MWGYATVGGRWWWGGIKEALKNTYKCIVTILIISLEWWLEAISMLTKDQYPYVNLSFDNLDD